MFKKNLLAIIILFVSIIVGYLSYKYLSGRYELIGVYISGTCLGIFLMTLKVNVKNSVINSYKRELEKESISSETNSARVKVLESKIEVLEKALENALKK